MITIRKYIEGDEKELWDLFYNTIRTININDYSPEQVNVWAPNDYNFEKWKNKIRSINPFVALIDDVIVGYTDLQSDGYIDHFYCHHAYQGKGVGSALMNHILDLGSRLEIKRYYSEVSITAKPFFEKFDFKVVKKQKVELSRIQLTNYLMERISNEISSY